ncbi:MAG TPA: hypothetical protein VFJ02_11910 [Vicinamibacterales bacterium]|nr:hypothetical protein [Vicinamibacterales bacterium]
MRHPFAKPGVAASLLMVLALAPLAAQAPKPAASATARQTLPAAREIIDRHIRAMGGRDAILAQTSTHVVGTVSMPAAGLNGKMETFHAKPNRFLQRMTLPGIGDIEEGFDGKVGWTTSPLTGPLIFEGRQLEERAFDADFFDELKSPERYASITTVEKTTFEERSAYKLRLVKKNGSEDFEFYDAETGFKIGGIATRESPMGPMQATSSFSDYKQFGPLRQPTSLKVTTLNVQMVMSILTLEYGNVDPIVFALPAQIKALVK